MKKCLLVLTALAVTGCAHAQFRADYLAEYAGYDCSALESQMSISQGMTSPTGLEKHWYRDAQSALSKSYKVVVANKVFWSNAHDVRVGAPPSPDQKQRMSNHARQQAILQLQTRKGCRNKEAVTNT